MRKEILKKEKMRNLRMAGSLFVVALAVALVAARPAAAQFGPGAGMQQPDFRGVWNPVVGSGAAYEMDSGKGKNEMELTLVGKEDVAGKPGYWVEMAMNMPNGGGQMYAKTLMVFDGKNGSVARMIIQPPGAGPMEMPNMGNRNQPPPSADIRDAAEKVGTEDVVTPAGTLSCDHYRDKDGKWDAWISAKVTPWGLVKSKSGDTTMTVVRVITDAKDHITGTPTQFNPGGFGGLGGGRPRQ